MENPQKMSLVSSPTDLKKESKTEFDPRRNGDAGGALTSRETLSSRFTILEPIARTSISTIYLARHHQLPEEKPDDSDGIVNLNVLSDNSAEDRRRLELFYLESYAASKLSHKNIIGAGKAKLIDTTYYYEMEHKPDVESLRDLIERYAWLEPDVAIGIMLQVASALEYAHKEGVLHLQLQPEKILIDSKGIVYVTGFGIDLDDPAWTHQGRSHHCAAQYLSPEQSKDERCDHRSDLYSLGIVFYEMLTDRVPFDAESRDLIKHKHLTQAPLPPRLFSPHIPEGVSNLILKLLKKNPAQRLESAKVLLSEFNQSPEIRPGSGAEEREIEKTSNPDEEFNASPDIEKLPVNQRQYDERPDLVPSEPLPPMADLRRGETKLDDEMEPDKNQPPVSAESKATALSDKTPEPGSSKKAKNHYRLLYVLAIIILILVIIGIVALGPEGRLSPLLQKLGFSTAGSLIQPVKSSNQTPPAANEKFKFDAPVNKRRDPPPTAEKPPADEKKKPRQMTGGNNKILPRRKPEANQGSKSERLFPMVKPRGKRPSSKSGYRLRRNSPSQNAGKAETKSKSDKKKGWAKKLLDKLFQ